MKGGIFLERPRDLEQELARDDERGIAPVRVRAFHGLRPALADRVNQRRAIHGSNAGLCSGTGRRPVVCCASIFAWSLSKPSRTYSGRGGQPGM